MTVAFMPFPAALVAVSVDAAFIGLTPAIGFWLGVLPPSACWSGGRREHALS